MQMLMNVTFPHKEFNAALRDGSLEQKMGRVLDEIKPIAVYFTEHDGHRGAVMIIDLDDPSKIPAFSEPFFLLFNGDVNFRIVMTPQDLQRAGLAQLAKKWA